MFQLRTWVFSSIRSFNFPQVIKRVNIEQIKSAEEIEGNPSDIAKVMDKTKTRIPGQRLKTRCFVEFSNGNTQWLDSDFVPDRLLEDFNAVKNDHRQ